MSMLTLTPFRPEDLGAVRKINRSLAASLEHDPDVLRETALTVRERGKVTGAGYLAASAQFLWLMRQNPGAFSGLSLSPSAVGSPENSAESRADRLCAEPPRDFGLFTQFQAAGSSEIEASALLLNALEEKAAEIASRLPSAFIHRTIWCRGSREAYLEFLNEFGFEEKASLLTLQKSLFPEASLREGEGMELPEGLFFDDPDLTDTAEMDRYIYGNGLGFGIPDSSGNMLYRMSVLGARALTLTDRKRVIASVTLYPDGGGAATEDIFCIPEYRRRGLTTALLKEAFRRKRQEGFREVHLNVYEDNAPALSLYRSLGYAQTDRIAELWG